MSRIVPYSHEAAQEAARLLAQGRLVALPTETVYGLAADAANGEAVARIYAAKGRPSFNPLIVHVADMEMAGRYAEISPLVEALIDAFWPGPLSLVLALKKGAPLSPLVTAGLDTVALRSPAAAPARDVLATLGRPFAAPSANPSGGLSPTTARHVATGLGSQVALIVDHGPCEVGVESTILKVDQTLTLLRPGSVTLAQIEKVTGQTVEVNDTSGVLLAPGMMESHYAPMARLRLNVTEPEAAEIHIGFGATGDDPALNLSPSGDLIEAAANLFAHLHEADAKAGRASAGIAVAGIAVAPIPADGLGLAINDRLARAAAPKDAHGKD